MTLLHLQRSTDGGRMWKEYRRLPAVTADLLANLFPHIFRILHGPLVDPLPIDRQPERPYRGDFT